MPDTDSQYQGQSGQSRSHAPWPQPHPGWALQILGGPGLKEESGRWWETSHERRERLAIQEGVGLRWGPHFDGQKPIISHPSYISDAWGGELCRAPRRSVSETRGVRALDRRKGESRKPQIKRVNIRKFTEFFKEQYSISFV